MIPKTVKSVLNKHKKRDDWFLDDYSINPYEGCSCNCLYCYIRGSKYGENMSDKLAYKSNALSILEKQLKARAAKGQYGFVAVGSATDAYMPQEEELNLTRGMLELLLQYRFPVFISTKRTLILRDLSILKEIDKEAMIPDDLAQSLKRGVILSVSISTLKENISNVLEPGAVTPLQRLQLIKQLKEEGFLAGVNAIPLLPFISDTEDELEGIIAAAKEHDADYILAGSLTLFGNDKGDSKTLYYKFLEHYNPDLIPHYDELYSGLHYPPATYHAALKKRVDALCKKYQLRSSIQSHEPYSS